MTGIVLAVSSPGLFVAFGAGMLSFLSPCVLPLVPGYLSLMSGVSTAQVVAAGTGAARTGPGRGPGSGSAGAGADARRMLRPTLLFVAGFTLVFTALGAAASALGGLLQQHQRGLEQIAGLTTIVMGLVVAGIVTSPLLARERRWQVSPSKLGSFAPPVMGAAFAFGWTPCIGPVLAAVLSIAAAQSTLAHGVALLVAYSLGLGVPFVAAGLAFGRLTGAFDWVKRHFRVVNLVSGLLLAGFGVLLLTGRVTRLAVFFTEVMDRLGLDRLTVS